MTTPRQPRTIELTVEVPGTPEQVWAAIATGPGITAWMHPTEVEEREGGTFTYDMGAGVPNADVNNSGVVTGWEPSRRFAQRSHWQPASGDLPAVELATEWLVEARSGDTCVVRMVMSGFGSGADWDNEVEGMTGGLAASLRGLRSYLARIADETEIRAVIDGRADALRAKDAGRFLSHYAPEVASFGLAPPLRYPRAEEQAMTEWFGGFAGSIGFEIRDLAVTVGGDVAFSVSLNRMTGTRTGGDRTDLWYRETLGLRRTGDGWSITHEHDSVPFHMDGSDKAALDLVP